MAGLLPLILLLAWACKEKDPDTGPAVPPEPLLVQTDSLLQMDPADTDRIRAMVHQAMGSFRSAPAVKGNDIYRQSRTRHEVLAIGGLQLGSRQRFLAVVGTQFEGNECHACPGVLSWLEFEKGSTGLELTATILAGLEIGQCGHIGACQIGLVGKGMLAAVVENEWMFQGSCSIDRVYVFRMKDQLRTLGFTLHSDDYGNMNMFEEDTYSADDTLNMQDNGSSARQADGGSFTQLTSNASTTSLSRFEVGDSMYVFKESSFGVQNGVPFHRSVLWAFSGPGYQRRDISAVELLPRILPRASR